MSTKENYAFRKNVKVKVGYVNACIYDFNNKKNYLISKECAHKLLMGSSEFDCEFLSKLQALQLLSYVDSEQDKSPEEFSYELFDDANSYKKCTLVYLEVTGHCNFRCLHCYANMEQTTSEYLHYNDAVSMMHNLKHLGACDIRLTGGEPFLNPDINKIITLIANTVTPNHRHSIATNGSFSLEQVRFAIDAGYEIQVSIYGMKPSSFQSFTHAEEHVYYDLFHKLKCLGKTPYAQYITLALSVNDITYHEIDELISFAYENGFNYVLNRAASAGRATENWKKIKLKEHEQHEFAKIQRKPIPSFCYHLCQLFWTSIRVNGDVQPCPYIREKKYTFGNIYNDSFWKIWRSKRYDDFRKLTASDVDFCQNCEFIYVCTAGCCAEALGYSHNIKAVYPWCEIRPYENENYLVVKDQEVYIIEKLSAGVFDFFLL